MLKRKVLRTFAVLILVVTAIGVFALEATTSTSRDFAYLIDHTAPTLHALSHLKAATARLLLEAERLANEDGSAQAAALSNARSGFEEALAEYEVTAMADEHGAGLAQQIRATGTSLLAQAAALPENGTQLESNFHALQESERQLVGYLEQAIAVESEELRQGDTLADNAAAARRQSVLLATGGGLILALIFGTLLIRQAGIEEEVQVRLQRAKTELQEKVSAHTHSLREANEALAAELEKRGQTEAALAQSEERFRTAAEGALVGIYIIQDDRFRYVNPTLAGFLGYKPEELIDTVSPLNLVHPAERQVTRERILERLAGIVADKPHRFRALHRDGREVVMESLARSARFQDRPAIIGTMLDITQQQEAEVEIAQRNRELQALLSISQRLAGEFELAERLEAITDAIVETMAAADAASLWLYDAELDEWKVNAGSGYDEEEIASLRAPTAEALARLVSETGQPRLVTGRKSWTGASRARQEEDGKRSLLGVPIVLEGHLMGALFVSGERAFDQHDLRLLQSVAGEAGIAIRNAQLLAATRRHQEELQQLSQQLLTAREAEARRISRELHDVMGQSLTAISINLAKVRRTLPPETLPRLQQRLLEAETLTAQTLHEVRELSLDLRPSMLDDLGLLPTLRWYLHRFGQRLGIEAALEVDGFSGRLAPEVETMLYRVIQEGLTNVARHAQATSVWVKLCCRNQHLALTIADNGIGFNAAGTLPHLNGEHIGLLGMRERVALLGGHIRIESAPQQGTRLLIHLPYLAETTPASIKQPQELP